VKRILVIILSLGAIVTHAQNKFSISGTISDKSNGETLIGATVSLKGSNTGTTTNEYGFYSLTIPSGEYTLLFSYLGYASKEQTIQLSADTKLNMELSDEAAQLAEVVVIAENTNKANIKTPEMSVNKLSARAIKQIPAAMGEVDVLKSIQLLPGITNAGEGAAGFNVRGGAADQNLVILDEAIIYNTSHLFGFFSVFNNDAIKNIKLYKGGIPSRFGGRASSVLEIVQKEGNKKDFNLTGGLGAISSRLTVEGPTVKDKGSFLLAGRSTYVNLFLAAANNDSRAGFYDFNLKTNYNINDNNRIFLSGYYGQDNMSFSNAFKNNYGNISGNLRWNHIFNQKLFSNLSLIYSRYDIGFEITNIGLDWDSNIKNYNLKYDFGYFPSDKLKMNFGISSIYYDFSPGELKPASADANINESILDKKYAVESAAYVNLEHKITDRLTAQYGLRYSHFMRLGEQTLAQYANDLPVVYNETLGIYERATPIGQTTYASGKSIKNFGNFEPRLGLSYQLDQSSSVKASYNRIAQYLHLISNTTSISPLDVWVPSGSFIDPQIANQYAIGYFKNLRNDSYALEVEAYYKTIDNRVDYIDGADLIAQNNIETEILQGKSRAYGLEFLLRKNKGNLTGWLSYTLSKSEQLTPGGAAGGLGLNNGNWYNTVYDRTHDISITASYKLNKRWRFGANFVFQTGRPVTYPNGQYNYNGLSVATYADRNADRLPAYHRLDVSATFTPKKNEGRRWHSEWVFGIYNLYNRRNAASVSFGQNGATGLNEATRTAIFRILPSVTYNFKF
jgi:hypothetical protein